MGPSKDPKMKLQKTLLTTVFMLAAAGCGEPAADEAPVAPAGESSDVAQATTAPGSFLFTRETFGGNGRVCSTCHTSTGTLSPTDIQKLAPGNVLFHPIDSD